jgi:hypothetical protein
MDAALRAAQWKYDNALPPIDERAEQINGWLESQACTDWIAEAVDTLVDGKDFIWSQSGRRRVGIFAHQLHDKIADEFSAEWQAYCHACLLDHQQRTDDSKQTKELAWSALNTVMRSYAFQIASDRAAEYAAHLIDKEAADASEWGV